MKLIKTLTLAISISFAISTNAQFAHWILGGNNTVPAADNILTHPDFLGIAFGTPAVNAKPLFIGTGGISSIYVDALLGAHPHFVGIGIGFAAPNELLTVNNGSINLQTTGNDAYRFDDNKVLWYNNVLPPALRIFNIYVGVNAGNNGSSGLLNTFVGYACGNLNTTGSNNTFGGGGAGSSNKAGYSNTFWGSHAGTNNITGDSDTFVGAFAGNANVNMHSSTFVGFDAGTSNTAGFENTFVGSLAGENNTRGNQNVFVGYQAGQHNTTALHNTFIGAAAGLSNTRGIFNTFTGTLCARDNTTGNFNSCYGKHCMASNIDGSYNCVFGTHAAFSGAHINMNVYIGYLAGFADQTNNNVMIGYNAGGQAGPAANAGNGNVFIGYVVAPTFLYGQNNILLGQQADAIGTLANPINDAVAIGSTAITTKSNTIILGNNDQWTGIGLSNSTPANSLEINARTLGTGTIIPNTSGLRFTQLTSSSPTIPNPGAGVLALNSTGDVIYVPSTSGAGVGAGYCPAPTILTGNAGYDLGTNGTNFYFEGTGASSAINNVIIGNPCTYTPKAKLDVLQATTGSFNTVGIRVENDDAPTTGSIPIGIQSVMPVTSNCPWQAPSVAAWFQASTCAYTIGQYNYSIFVAPGPSPNGNFLTGVVSIGYPYGSLPSPSPAAGIPYLLYVDGGTSAITYGTPSDRKFKTGFTAITNAIGKIDSIHPYYFYYDTVTYSRFNFPSNKQVGFIAQNVDSVLPEVVSASDSGYSMDYSRMTALLLAGMQQQQGTITRDSLHSLSQQQTIDSLRNVLNSIQSCLNNLCDDNHHHRPIKQNDSNNSSNLGSTLDITLSNSAILYQNAPNPFGSGGTKINYFLPEGTMGASIVFLDSYGTKLKEVQLTQTGMGTININPSQLTEGIYTYSLVVNGNVVDTKKMVYSK